MRRRIPERREGARLVERAYQLARSGALPSVEDIRKQLIRDGYTNSEVELNLRGAMIRWDLARLCRTRTGEHMPDDKSKRGEQDRSRVSESDDYEVREFANTHGITQTEVSELIQKHGSDRKTLEAEAKKLKGA
jgi:Protein of unknown function (DUF3606)